MGGTPGSYDPNAYDPAKTFTGALGTGLGMAGLRTGVNIGRLRVGGPALHLGLSGLQGYGRASQYGNGGLDTAGQFGLGFANGLTFGGSDAAIAAFDFDPSKETAEEYMVRTGRDPDPMGAGQFLGNATLQTRSAPANIPQEYIDAAMAAAEQEQAAAGPEGIGQDVNPMDPYGDVEALYGMLGQSPTSQQAATANASGEPWMAPEKTLTPFSNFEARMVGQEGVRNSMLDDKGNVTDKSMQALGYQNKDQMIELVNAMRRMNGQPPIDAKYVTGQAANDTGTQNLEQTGTGQGVAPEVLNPGAAASAPGQAPVGGPDEMDWRVPAVIAAGAAGMGLGALPPRRPMAPRALWEIVDDGAMKAGGRMGLPAPGTVIDVEAAATRPGLPGGRPLSLPGGRPLPLPGGSSGPLGLPGGSSGPLGLPGGNAGPLGLPNSNQIMSGPSTPPSTPAPFRVNRPFLTGAAGMDVGAQAPAGSGAPVTVKGTVDYRTGDKPGMNNRPAIKTRGAGGRQVSFPNYGPGQAKTSVEFTPSRGARPPSRPVLQTGARAASLGGFADDVARVGGSLGLGRIARNPYLLGAAILGTGAATYFGTRNNNQR